MPIAIHRYSVPAFSLLAGESNRFAESIDCDPRRICRTSEKEDGRRKKAFMDKGWSILLECRRENMKTIEAR